MAIVFTAAGTGASGSGVSISPGLPAGFSANDIHVLCLTITAGTVGGLAPDWNEVINSGDLKVWWRRAVGGDVAPTVTGGSGDNAGRIYGFSGCATSSTPFSRIGAVQATTGVTINAPSISVPVINQMILFVHSYQDGASVASSVSGWSGTDPTFTDRGQVNFAGTDNIGVGLASGIDTDLDIGARTATIDSSSPNLGVLLALREPDTVAAEGGVPVGEATAKLFVTRHRRY